MKQVIHNVKYWGQLFYLPVYWISFLFPRDKRIWLFGSGFGKRFADNPRYFYLYVNQMIQLDENSINKEAYCIDGKPIRPIWISHNKGLVTHLNDNGYEAYYHRSPKGIWYCLRGKIYLFDNYSKDISFWLSGGAKKINMWHGIPLKKIQHDNVFDRFRHPKNLKDKIYNFPRNISDEKSNHYILTTSQFLKEIFASAFQTENVLVCGYPRCDRLVGAGPENCCTKAEKQELTKLKNCVQAKNKMVYYMPTFRESEVQFFDVMNLDTFQTFLKEEGIIFCVKLHPKSKLRKEFKKIEGEQIVVVDADADPYVFLELADVLVTDYSSIYFDYLLMDRPIVFFSYDLEAYLANSREMYFDYEEYTPGRKAASQIELQVAIKNAILDEDVKINEKRNKIRNKMFEKEDKQAGAHLLEAIKHIV